MTAQLWFSVRFPGNDFDLPSRWYLDQGSLFDAAVLRFPCVSIATAPRKPAFRHARTARTVTAGGQDVARRDGPRPDSRGAALRGARDSGYQPPAAQKSRNCP